MNDIKNTKGRHKCDDKKSNYTIFYKLEDSVVGGIVEDIRGSKMALDDIAVKYGINSTTSLMSVLKRYKGEDFVNNLMVERRNSRNSRNSRSCKFKRVKFTGMKKLGRKKKVINIGEIILLYREKMSPFKISQYLGLNGRHNEIRVILEGNLSSEEFLKIAEEIKLKKREKMNRWVSSCVW